LVFYHDTCSALDKVLRITNSRDSLEDLILEFMQFKDFCEIKEIGAGGYGTVYIAKHKAFKQRIALKCFRSFDQMPELFISEVSTLDCYYLNLNNRDLSCLSI